MSRKYEGVIINKLLDKYEKSKSFTGDNKVNQKFSIKVSTMFSKYQDHSNYEVFNEVNEAIHVLIRKKIVLAKANKSHMYDELLLNVDQLDASYEYIGRKSKRAIHDSLIVLLEGYKSKNVILSLYCVEQMKRIHQNLPVEYYKGDLGELENILKACDELLKVKSETFQRDFSVKIFKDSKVFEGISSKVIHLLFQYGDFPSKEAVLGNLNIIKNPTYVNFKGSGVITINGQKIDLSKLSSDIGISSKMLIEIECIKVINSKVITIENLTSFHSFEDKNILAIYLGGYHNRVRREFIQKIYTQNPHAKFYHFGDIDAGGFYILEHLKRETGIEFEPYKMDLYTFKNHIKYAKKLTENDRKRLLQLKDSQHYEVIQYMLEHNCKLEQEAVECG